MRALGFGIVAAFVVAGPTLYPLVQDGSMNGETALIRGGIVALACAVGFALVVTIGSSFRAPASEDDGAEASDQVHVASSEVELKRG